MDNGKVKTNIPDGFEIIPLTLLARCNAILEDLAEIKKLLKVMPQKSK